MVEPINNIVWKSVDELTANDYNPNVVFNRELRLLEYSIIKTGWIQPILIDAGGIIIDGFHRWKLYSFSKELKDKYENRVPCAVLDISEPERMLLTIRINRAKGSHIAFKMADIIKKLIDNYCFTFEYIAKSIGGDKDEVALLYENSIFSKKNVQTKEYSRAWVPAIKE